jgi:large subunit ribosomal protein L17
MKSLVLALVTHKKILTTEPKAKELRPMVEKLITLAKKGDMASYRILVSRVGTIAAKELFSKLGPDYKDRKGGYTRITKLPARLSDASMQAVIEFV